jgi:predicted MFS family arabinose efflux permease
MKMNSSNDGLTPAGSLSGQTTLAGPVAAPVALSRPLILLFAMTCGLSVANVYCAHPLLDAMARDLAINPASIGVVITVTQVGYALGLVFIVPLGDLIDRRRLIITQALLSALALAVVALAPTRFVLLAGLLAVGLLSVLVQVLVAFAASLAAPDERGRVVGKVTSGVVIGILLARFVSGALADIGGWRSVYLTSAVLMLLMAAALVRVLPNDRREAAVSSYPDLLRSVVVLLRDEPILRTRATLAFLIFAAFNVLWAPLVLPLSAPPFSLSHTQIGLFGLAGVAGALAAGIAGRLADRGSGQKTTGLALAVLLMAWIPIAFLPASLLALSVGIVMLDLAIQAVHVTSQSLIFSVRAEAGSRLVAGYMVFYSIGSAAGAITSTMIYARDGWSGVCLLGGAISVIALVFWSATRHVASHRT